VEDACEAIEKRDKERAEKEAQVKQKMLDIIKRRERVVLNRAGIIA
jgi:predicted ribonuclease toxin of YeeF-YezG toxin-antitoxin module